MSLSGMFSRIRSLAPYLPPDHVLSSTMYTFEIHAEYLTGTGALSGAISQLLVQLPVDCEFKVVVSIPMMC